MLSRWAIHTWGKMQIADYLEDSPYIPTACQLFPPHAGPWRQMVDCGRFRIGSSEKLAMAYYLDGRVSALWGTHTHVPTADHAGIPQGYRLRDRSWHDRPRGSVLGIRPEQSVEFFLGGLPGRYQAAEGPCSAQGCILP